MACVSSFWCSRSSLTGCLAAISMNETLQLRREAKKKTQLLLIAGWRSTKHALRQHAPAFGDHHKYNQLPVVEH